MALGLGRRGYDVAVHYAGSEAGASAVAAEIEAMGQRAVPLQADLLDDAAVAALIGRASGALGGALTCLVNSASIFEPDSIEDATLASWYQHIGTNLKAPMFLSQAFAAQAPRAVADAGAEPLAQAVIVNMVDQRVRKLTPEFMTYTLAKAGLWTLTQTTARALAPHVRVNAIAPGPTLAGRRQSEADFATQRAATVLERGVNPEEIVAALDYLLDAPGVTGQCLNVDGGQHLGWQTPDVLMPE
jgi:NAD(P)-dependent dehydrogenase (short-subunit alcohol dehydrogenase family)